MNKQEMQTEALRRVHQSDSVSNYDAIYDGFEAMGIDADDIEPRVNVFAYNAWQAKGRQVRRGEHGVKVTTWITMKNREPDADGNHGSFKRQKTATVFHASQTDLIQ